MQRTSTFAARRHLSPLCALAALLIVSGCGDSPTEARDRIVEGVNLTTLFAPPTAAERAAVEADWEGRDVSMQGYRLESSESATLGSEGATLQIVSHTVDGFRHYGAVIVPDGFSAGELPVLFYGHGGDQGFSVAEFLVVAGAVHGSGSRFVYAAPSFRSEPLAHLTQTFVSEGSPSPWDRDVDDALALLNTVIATVPEADATRIGVLGFSRGGGVGLLMGIRDPRIDLTVNFFGPTDFFDRWVQEVVEDALRRTLRPLPGLAHLDSTFIQPVQRGEIALEEFRVELVRRSAVHFASALPPLQTHHGDADAVVRVTQAISLRETLNRLGRTRPDYAVFIYSGAGHSPFDMPLALPRTFEFLERLQQE